jgi:hypothetical protein
MRIYTSTHKDADRAHETADVVETMLKKLDAAARVEHAQLSCGGATTAAFDAFLAARGDEIRALDVGDFVVWCGGWSGTGGGHAIMYQVDRPYS